MALRKRTASFAMRETKKPRTLSATGATMTAAHSDLGIAKKPFAPFPKQQPTAGTRDNAMNRKNACNDGDKKIKIANNVGGKMMKSTASAAASNRESTKEFNTKAVIRVIKVKSVDAFPDHDKYEKKLEASKRKLQERYKQIEVGKKGKKMMLLELKDIPRKSRDVDGKKHKINYRV